MVELFGRSVFSGRAFAAKFHRRTFLKYNINLLNDACKVPDLFRKCAATHNPGINPELLKSSLVKHNTNLLHDVCKVLFFRKCAASTISEKTELLFRTNTISEKTELPNNPNIESQFGTIMIFKHGRKVNFARFKFERRSKSWKTHKPQIFQIYLPFSKISIAAQFMGSTGSTGPTTLFEACPSPSAGPTTQLKLMVASTPDGRLMNGGTPACRFNARVGK